MVMARKREKKEKDIIDQMLDNIDFRGLTQDEVVGQNGLIKQLTGRILQKALEAEMTEHLGYEKNSNAGDNSGNSGNGHTEKTVLLENQSATIEVPRDRNSTFEPIIVHKNEKRLPLFNDQIISMYSFGMTDRDIKSHLEKIYNVEVSPDLISRVTSSVLEDVREWQNRPLEKSYAIVYLDALRVKGKTDGKSCQKSVYTAFTVNFEGKKEVLGLWIAENEGGEVLDGRAGRAEKPRASGHPYSLHGRADRLPRGGAGSVPRHPSAAVRCPHGPRFHQVRFVQGH
jgi:putative transposase